MRSKHFISVLAVSILMLTGFSTAAQSCKQNSNAVVVERGQHNYDKMPEKSKQFIARHFSGVTISECEYFAQYDKYEVELANGYDIEFEGNGNVREIDSDDSFFTDAIVKELLPAPAYQRLVGDGVVGKVEAIDVVGGQLFEIDVDVPGPDTYIFEADGTFVTIEE